MKKILGFLITVWALIASSVAIGQEVKWSSSVANVEGDLYNITFTAEIPMGWHMYEMGEMGGYNATRFTIAANDGVELVGEMKQMGEPVRKFDQVMGMELGYFEGKADFTQQVRLLSKSATLEVNVESMICGDQACMPPSDVDLTIAIPSDAVVADRAEVKSADAAQGGSLWLMIIEAIIWGFAALLTPCVFPMVPMTVSFFLKGSENKTQGRFRALMYGLFIVLLYTIPITVIIMLTKIIGGDAVTANIFNWLATHWIPNLLFFTVFMVFAASFFGAFEIVMPSKLVNDSDTKSSGKGLGGIFFMAFTLVLVSFSCTGPIVGTVLIKSISGEIWAPIITMLAFSLAFALPFTLFALFPSWLKKLPKSGGWLNSVKVVIGFVELALGLKFLSVADQTYHWGLLDREVYLALWIVIFTMLGFYLLGKLKFKHDSEVKYVSVTRLSLAIIVFAFVVYMIPGMWGAPLKALSGYLPPMHTQDFIVGATASVDGVAVEQGEERKDVSGVRYGDKLSLPYDLDGFFHLGDAEKYAAEVDKPLFIDFTGHGCVNCREMESRVWSDPRVLDILRNDYVIVALYSDDRMQVDEADWVTTDAGKVLKTLGKINSHFALTQYGVNAQPYYVLQGSDGEVLVEPRGYDLDVEGFVKFLQSGVEAYKNSRK